MFDTIIIIHNQVNCMSNFDHFNFYFVIIASSIVLSARTAPACPSLSITSTGRD